MEQVPSANASFPNVVVVNDDITQLNVLCGLLRKAGMTPVPFQSAETALAQMNPQRLPDLIITDLYMPGIDGWRFCRLLRSPEYKPFNQTAILVVSSIFSGDEPARIASELGANAFLSMSAGGQVFIQRVQSLLKGQKSQETCKVLLVEPDEQQWSSLLKAFQTHGYQVDAVTTVQESLERIENTVYDVAVLEAALPDGTGDGVLNVLRAKIANCVCLMTTDISQPERALEWMKMGAAAYLQKPFEAEYLVSQCDRARRERTLLRTQDELEERTRQLQQSEQLFRELFEKHTAVKLLIDPDSGQILDANLEAVNYYGWSKEHLKRMRIQDINILPPEEVQQEMQEAKNQKRIHFEFRHRRADGSIRDVAVFSSGIQVNDKTVLHSIVQDITEQKQAERALLEQGLFQEKIFKTTHDGFWLLDAAGKFIEVNDAYCQMSGYSREEILQFSIADVNPWEDPAMTVARCQRIMANGSEIFETRHRKKDGSILYAEVSVTYLDAHGGQYICFGRDITIRKQIEQDLSLKSHMLDQIKDLVTITDLQGRITYANQAELEVMAMAREELIGNTTSIYGEDAARGATQKEIVENTLKNGFWRCEVVNYARDGSEHIMDCRTQVVRDSEGTPIALCGIATDISERKRLEAALTSRLVALTRPFDQPESIGFLDLFDLDVIQHLQDDFSAATGVASIITWPDGTPITRPSNFCRLCQNIIRSTDQGRANCFKSDCVLGAPSAEGPIIQPCLSGGLWDAGAGISVDGRHIANWLIGQVRDDTQTEEKMRAYAREIGADEADFMRAYNEVPVMSQEQFQRVAQALFTLAQQLSNTAYQNVQQARFITAQKKAESALRESTQLVQAVMGYSQYLIYIKDLDGQFILASQSLAEFFGQKTHTELIGKTSYDFLPKMVADQHWANDIAVMKKQDLLRIEETVETSEGVRTFLSTKFPLRDAEGKVYAVCGLSVDITERKKMEEALRDSEERFRNLSEDIPICVCSFLPDSTLTYVNSAQAALSGLTPDEMIGHKFFDLLDSQYLALVRNSLAALTPDEPTEGHEQVHIRSDGSIRYVEWRNRAFFDAHGQISYFLGVGLDITERKQVEEALRLSEEHYRNIFNNSVEGIFQTTIGGQYRVVNPSFAHMFGFDTPEEMITSITNIGEQLYVHPEDRVKLIELLSTTNGRVSNFEVQLKRKDGSQFWVSINISQPNKNEPVLEGTCMDITARKEAETKVNEQLDELRRWHNITLGRESRILELKLEVNQLLTEAGKPLRYASAVEMTGRPQAATNAFGDEKS